MPKPEKTYALHALQILECGDDGPVLRQDRDVVDLVGRALDVRAQWVVLPVARLGDDFFQLKTRLAGEIAQKFVNYGVRLAVVGDIAHYVEVSDALRDFVRESNRGRHLWFVANIEEFHARLPRA